MARLRLADTRSEYPVLHDKPHYLSDEHDDDRHHNATDAFHTLDGSELKRD